MSDFSLGWKQRTASIKMDKQKRNTWPEVRKEGAVFGRGGSKRGA